MTNPDAVSPNTANTTPGAAAAQRYHIRHVTRYTYSAPVSLNQTILRLQPRTDANQRLAAFEMRCDPKPARHTFCTDLHGNLRHWFWFENAHQHLEVVTRSTVDCLSDNAFDFILVDPGVETVPAHYNEPVGEASHHYRQRDAHDPAVNAFANEVLERSGPRTLAFLWELVTALHQRVAYTHRPEGAPWLPATTLAAERGSCRDAAVLFVDCCRAVGLAARFVSGYAFDAVNHDERELHAWAEVYLPGGGWKGYDPTTGLAVTNRHVAVAASPTADYAAPFAGTFTGPPVESSLAFDLTMQTDPLPPEPAANDAAGDSVVYRWH